jgi:hypothetical protein
MKSKQKTLAKPGGPLTTVSVFTTNNGRAAALKRRRLRRYIGL